MVCNNGFFQVSNLFPKDELDEIGNELIIPMKREFPRRPPTAENLYDYFITRARKNLHVVLCFSPVGITILKLPCSSVCRVLLMSEDMPINVVVK